MRKTSVSTLLALSSLVTITCMSEFAVAATPAEVAAHMRAANRHILDDVETIQTRCDNQIARKAHLTEVAAKRGPVIAVLLEQKTKLETELTANTAGLATKQTALSTLRAQIAALNIELKEAKLDTAIAIKNATAKLALDRASQKVIARALQVAIVTYDRWREANEYLLYPALLKLDSGEALSSFERAAVDHLIIQDQARESLSEQAADLAAVVAADLQALEYLKSGRRLTIDEIKTELTLKRTALRFAVSAFNVAKSALAATNRRLRVVNAQLNRNGGTIPEISPVCEKIDSVLLP